MKTAAAVVARPSLRFDVSLAHPHAESPFEHVPRFVIVAMQMGRCDVSRRTGWAAWVAPLGDNEVIVSGPEDRSGKRSRNHRRSHGAIQ